MFLSIVIPAYNESGRIEKTLELIGNFLEDRNIDSEVIVVDDGSTDDTTAVVKKSVLYGRGRIRILGNKDNRGKGYSVKRGVEEAKGEYVLFTDADLSTPIHEFDKLYAKLNEGADIAIGSRAIRGSRVSVRQPLYRQTMGRVFNLFIRMLTGETLADTQCGFKLFRKKAAKKLFEKAMIDGFAFDVEILFMARREGYRITEAGIEWVNSHESKVHPVFSSLEMVRDIIKMRIFHR